MLTVKNILATALVLGATSLALPAAALPVGGLDLAVARNGDMAGNIDQVRWVCGPYGCRHVPNYYYGGPRWGYGGGYRGGYYRHGYGYGRGYGYHGYRRW
jgi:hypothetical protein